MKHETVISSLKRYQRNPFTETERFGIGIVIVFFISMLLLFVIMPALFPL